MQDLQYKLITFNKRIEKFSEPQDFLSHTHLSPFPSLTAIFLILYISQGYYKIIYPAPFRPLSDRTSTVLFFFLPQYVLFPPFFAFSVSGLLSTFLSHFLSKVLPFQTSNLSTVLLNTRFKRKIRTCRSLSYRRLLIFNTRSSHLPPKSPHL